MQIENPSELSFEPFFVARQPILDADGKVWGYELLFRDSGKSVTAVIEDETFATVCVATCGFTFSQDDLSSATKLFINFPDNLIIEKAPKALPPSCTVVELMEHSDLTDDVFMALLDLKQAGYTVAIDDYQGKGQFGTFIEIADIVKVDVLGLSMNQVERIVRSLKGKKVQLLAEKVESREEYEKLKELGFTLFQGFYFAKPETLEGRKISSEQSMRLSILNEIQRPDIKEDEILAILRKDVSLSYRLLRFLNSPAFSFSVEIKSLSQAVRLIGQKRLKHWLRLVIVSDMSSSCSAAELCNLAISRAIFFEAISEFNPDLKGRSEEMYMFGLFSVLDSLLNTPMNEVVKFLPIEVELKEALYSESEKYHCYLELVTSIEKGNWDPALEIAEKIKLPTKEIQKAYLQSLLSSMRLNSELN